MLEKQVFSSSSLDEGQGERAKFSQWQEIHNAQIWSVDYALGNLPFSADIEATMLGPIVIGQMAGTIKQANRQRHHIAADGRDAYLLLINKGESALAGAQSGRDYSITRGQGALVSASEPLKMIGADRNLWSNIVIPQEVITSAFAHVNDRLAYSIDANNEALTLLSRYCHILDSGPPLTSPAVITHVSETILDLVGLATGAKGEPALMASSLPEKIQPSFCIASASRKASAAPGSRCVSRMPRDGVPAFRSRDAGTLGVVMSRTRRAGSWPVPPALRESAFSGAIIPSAVPLTEPTLRPSTRLASIWCAPIMKAAVQLTPATAPGSR